ncbi:hypothetical protein FKM82_014931 [Ascaphus truei]
MGKMANDGKIMGTMGKMGNVEDHGGRWEMGKMEVHGEMGMMGRSSGMIGIDGKIMGGRLGMGTMGIMGIDGIEWEDHVADGENGERGNILVDDGENGERWERRGRWGTMEDHGGHGENGKQWKIMGDAWENGEQWGRSWVDMGTDVLPRVRVLGGQDLFQQCPGHTWCLCIERIHTMWGTPDAEQWGNERPFNVVLRWHTPRPIPRTLQAGVRSSGQIPHPLYNTSTSTKHHDLLLLQLPEKAPVNLAVRPLLFQREDRDVPADTLCLVSGWGQVKLTGKRPDKLQEVTVPVISRDQCNRRDYYDNAITAYMMCAGAAKKDSCEGDSGGPLVCDGVAVGIVSSGYRKCGNAKRPGIYTRISPYASWIEVTMHNATQHSTAAPTVPA